MTNERIISTPYVYLYKMSEKRLKILSQQIETHFNSDLIFFSDKIDSASELSLIQMVNSLSKKSELKNKRLTIILETIGGKSNSVANMVNSIRRLYDYVIFVIPVKAISAGTLFCLSGNEIYLSKFSALGALDLQITSDSKCTQLPLKYLIKRLREIKIELNNNPNNKILLDELRAFVTNKEIIGCVQEQEVVKDMLIKFLKIYQGVKDERVLDIADSLINKENLDDNDLYFHDNHIYIEKINEMGINVKDYQIEHHNISEKIEEFCELNKEYFSIKGVKSIIYNRLVDNDNIIIESHTYNPFGILIPKQQPIIKYYMP